jgi:DNA-binding CsgD family transcriptional regulator
MPASTRSSFRRLAPPSLGGELQALLRLTVECRTSDEYDAARAAWLDRVIGFDTLYFGAAKPEVQTAVQVTGVDSGYVEGCESRADRYWPDRVVLNRLAVLGGGAIFDGDALSVRTRERMPFYGEVTAGLGIRAIAVSVLTVRGTPSRCLYLGRTSRGASFGRELDVFRAALPILALGAGVHDATLQPERRTSEAVPLSALTARERQVLQGICEGLTNRAIAARLGTSERTVKNQVASILMKTDTANRTELAVKMADTASSSPSNRPGAAPAAEPHEDRVERLQRALPA